MKIINFKLIFSIVLLFAVFISCEKDSTPGSIEYADGGTIKIGDPYLQIQTPVVSFQAGLADYKISTYLVNGLKAVTKVNMYGVYTDAKTSAKSNEALVTSFVVPAGNRVLLEKNLTYDDLKKGLTVNGGGLPADQKDLPVGSGWKFRFEGETSQGVIDLAGNVNVGVLSRFAGLYRVINSEYFRIGVSTAKWNGETRFIGSVNDATFSHNDYWGNFAWSGRTFHFVVNSDNSITVPVIVDGIFSGTYAINCIDHKDKFTSVPCTGTNILIKDDVNGKHRIKLTYGYFTEGSGSREFYEEMEKI
jgi:hypothetical protein